MVTVDDIFRVRPVNQESTEFIITVGNHLATEKKFTSKEEAELYKQEFHWEMIVALIAEMNYEFEEKLKAKKE